MEEREMAGQAALAMAHDERSGEAKDRVQHDARSRSKDRRGTGTREGEQTRDEDGLRPVRVAGWRRRLGRRRRSRARPANHVAHRHSAPLRARPQTDNCIVRPTSSLPVLAQCSSPLSPFFLVCPRSMLARALSKRATKHAARVLKHGWILFTPSKLPNSTYEFKRCTAISNALTRTSHTGRVLTADPACALPPTLRAPSDTASDVRIAIPLLPATPCSPTLLSSDFTERPTCWSFNPLPRAPSILSFLRPTSATHAVNAAAAGTARRPPSASTSRAAGERG